MRTKETLLAGGNSSPIHSCLGHNKYYWGMVLQPHLKVAALRSIWEEKWCFTGFKLRLSQLFGKSRGFSLIVFFFFFSFYFGSFRSNWKTGNFYLPKQGL